MVLIVPSIETPGLNVYRLDVVVITVESVI